MILSLPMERVSTSCYHSKIVPLSHPMFDEFYKKMMVKTLNPEWKCPLKRESLSYLWVSHWDAKGQSAVGEIIVATDVADNINKVFGKIFTEKYPIERMHPQDYYEGIDAKSMAANNTSGFRCSKEDQGGEHPNGHAVDINPLINPFIKPNEKKFEPVRGYEDPVPASLADAQKRYLIEPVEGWNFAFRANRNQLRANKGQNVEQMLFEDSAPTKAFESIGWFWGGKWNCCDDYQHFSINDM